MSLSPSGRNQQHEGPSPHGERREVGSSPHAGQREEGPVSHQTQEQTRLEVEEHARLWQEHLRRQHREPVQLQVPSRSATLPDHISSSATEIDAQVSARRRADIAAAEDALATAEELERSRTAAAADAQAAAVSAGQGTVRAREALHRTRAEGAKRHRGEAAVATRTSITTSAATRSALPATSIAAETSSAPRAASTSSTVPSSAMAARLDPPQQPSLDEVSVTGRQRRSGDHAFLQGSVTCIARQPRSIFAKEEAIAVVDSARTLLDELPAGGAPPVR